MSENDNNNNKDKSSNELVMGLVTFIVFIVFMTVWMYLFAE